MTSIYLLGLFLILLAGITQGAFPLPMKYTRTWKWEHIWFWYSIISLFLLPLLIAWVTVPHLFTVYSLVPRDRLLLTALFGFGWGFGSIFFGLGVDALGMALGFSLMTGLYMALGALIPLIILTPDLLLKRTGLLVISGNIVVIIGVAISAMAGKMRDDRLGTKPVAGMIGPRRSFRVGLIFCILCGVLSPLFNFGYAFGTKIIDAAAALGASRYNAVNALWLVEIPAGGILNVAYCVYLFKKNKTAGQLIGGATVADWTSAWVMGLLWTGSVVLYGVGAEYLGRLGPTLGWSLWNTILIVTTIICGLLTHEWDGARGKPLRLLYLGIGFLTAGMIL